MKFICNTKIKHKIFKWVVEQTTIKLAQCFRSSFKDIPILVTQQRDIFRTL